MAANPRKPRRTPNRSSTPRVAGRGATARPANQPDADAPEAAAPVESGEDAVTIDPAATDVDATTEGVEKSTAATESASAVDASGSVEAETVDTSTGSDDSEAVEVDPVESPRPTGKRRVSRVSTLRPGEQSAAPDSVARTSRGAGATDTENASPKGGGLPGLSNRALVIAGVVAAVLAVIALIGGLHPGASLSGNRAFVDRAATTELTSQVQAKACLLTVTTNNVDKWADNARAALTGPALKQFNEYLPQQKKILEQTQAIADCRVESVGVNDLSGGGDGATARVVVNMIVSQQMAGLNGQSGAPRYQFSMLKRGEQWLINAVEVF